MKDNNNNAKGCKGCESEKPIEVTNKFIVEEETIIVSEGVSSGESDTDLFL